MESFHSKRFLDAHLREFPEALAEIRNGRKQSHWMWYIFPQISGLGMSEISAYYAIQNLDEAKDYMEEPTLREDMLKICDALLGLASNDASKIFGFPDDLKLKSSMTLFDFITLHDSIFRSVLEKFYQGEKDKQTIKMLTL